MSGGNIITEVTLTPGCNKYQSFGYTIGLCNVDNEIVMASRCDISKDCKKYNQNN
ncbi:MAG: hypothetical protein AABW81_03300 [Nanoarchaeota archaeon]